MIFSKENNIKFLVFSYALCVLYSRTTTVVRICRICGNWCNYKIFATSITIINLHSSLVLIVKIFAVGYGTQYGYSVTNIGKR